MVKNGDSSYKTDYMDIFSENLNLEGHPNRCIGSKVKAILLNGWILPIGWASAVEGLRSTGLPRLVLFRLRCQMPHVWKSSMLKDATPPLGKIPPFTKIAVSFEPMNQLRCPSRYRISKKFEHNLFLDWKHYLQPLGRGDALKIFSQRITHWFN